ncbi:MAG: hypothetical protein K8R21_03005 [Leptospira sp.]|nr:hypothetical protein [Leptospira sp.]
MLIRIIILFIALSFTLLSYNPWDSKITERIINRKQVNNIIIESKADHYRVTLLVCDRFPYNHKSHSYPFYIRIYDEKKALLLAQKLDKYLEKGNEIAIKLKGSEIISYKYNESQN